MVISRVARVFGASRIFLQSLKVQYKRKGVVKETGWVFYILIRHFRRRFGAV